MMSSWCDEPWCWFRLTLSGARHTWGNCLLSWVSILLMFACQCVYRAHIQRCLLDLDLQLQWGFSSPDDGVIWLSVSRVVVTVVVTDLTGQKKDVAKSSSPEIWRCSATMSNINVESWRRNDWRGTNHLRREWSEADSQKNGVIGDNSDMLGPDVIDFFDLNHVRPHESWCLTNTRFCFSTSGRATTTTQNDIWCNIWIPLVLSRFCIVKWKIGFRCSIWWSTRWGSQLSSSRLGRSLFVVSDRGLKSLEKGKRSKKQEDPRKVEKKQWIPPPPPKKKQDRAILGCVIAQAFFFARGFLQLLWNLRFFFGGINWSLGVHQWNLAQLSVL